jgi:hypothetical protein
MLLESFFSILDHIDTLALDLLSDKCWGKFLLAIDRKLMSGYPEEKPKVLTGICRLSTPKKNRNRTETEPRPPPPVIGATGSWRNNKYSFAHPMTLVSSLPRIHLLQ